MNPVTPRSSTQLEHEQELEQSLVTLATVLLHKSGRRSLRMTQEDMQEAMENGPAELTIEDEGRTATYRLPTKNKKRGAKQ